MLKVNIVAVGSIKEKFFKDAIDEYKKRLSRFCVFNIIEVSEESAQKNLDVKAQKESERLLSASKGTRILLDRQGKMVASEDLADIVSKCENSGTSEVSFIIGGSNGVSESFAKECKYVISFGKITFPHQLFRVVLSEQIYRAFSIKEGMPYHKWHNLLLQIVSLRSALVER